MSHCLASLSRWLVGSSRRSASLPAKRIRVSSTRRRSPPESASIGRSRRSSLRPSPAAMPPDLRVRGVPAGVAELLLGDRRSGRRHARIRSPRPAAGASRPGPRQRRDLAPRARATWRSRRLLRHAGRGFWGRKPRSSGRRTTPEAAGASPESTLQEARLAGAVATHEPDLVAGSQAERRLEQGRTPTDLD